MPLQIQTTGLDQYAPGGNAVLKLLLVGGPGTGKTRMSSFWPKPIYADCEAGLSSIADRAMPFVAVKTSQDMLDLLAMLKSECRRPYADRRYQTVVVDTLDAFQRKVKDEWLQANPGAQSFRGFDAWGYLDSKMQMLLTRLLNLDMHVIVAVHHTDKKITEGTGENATERQEIALQLAGTVKDSVFNDFDLVGWMGTYWAAEEGQRVEKRGLSFKKTPERPFLKDRLNIMPSWMEVTFSDADYSNLFSALVERLDDIGETRTIGEIESGSPTGLTPVGGVVSADSPGGALPAQPAKDMPLEQLDKPTLTKMARDAGLKFAGNTIKSELVTMIRQAASEQASKPEAAPDGPVGDAAATSTAADGSDATAGAPANPADGAATSAAAPSPAASEPAAEPTPSQTVVDQTVPAHPVTAHGRSDDSASGPDQPAVLDASLDKPEQAGVDEPPAAAPNEGATAPKPSVDPDTGEMSGPMTEQQVADALGGTVLSVTEHTEAPAMASPAAAPAPAAPASSAGFTESAAAPGQACSECGKSLVGENQDYVKLSMIKYRKYLCNADYLAARKTAGR